jgi:hypothetical protein
VITWVTTFSMPVLAGAVLVEWALEVWRGESSTRRAG